MTLDLGPVRRWREGDVLYAENDVVRCAYVVTDDPEKLAGFGMGLHGADQICVTYITAEEARAWP